MTPPTTVPALTVTPGAPMTFSGTATDDENLANVEIQLRNSTTRQALASDGTWAVDNPAGWFRITPLNVNADTLNWTWTTPGNFDLRPGTYTFSVRATDDLELSTSSQQQGRLTLNAQIPGDLPPNALLDVTGTILGGQVLALNLTGTATDDFGVESVRVVIQDRDTSRYLQPNGTVSGLYAELPATLATPNGTSTTWSLSRTLPTQGDWAVTAYGYDTSGQVDTSTSGATARYEIYPGDLPPTFNETLRAPQGGEVFNEGRIPVTGRVEDDQQIASVQVAIRNAAGQYMSSTGTFTSTTESWRTAFLNSPGSPGSNYSYTTPVIPAGAYTVRVRGVDQHGFTTNPPLDAAVTVTQPANNPPVANFTYTCNQNICGFDGRTSTDENVDALTYTWAFTSATTGTGSGSTSGNFVSRTFSAAKDYTATLTVRDEYGLTSTSAPQTITIVEPTNNVAPTATIAAPTCTGLTCAFSATVTEPNVGDSVTRLWSFGTNPATTSTSTSPTKTFPAAGTYIVSLTVTDGWGKFTTATRTVNLVEPAGNQPPNVTWSQTCTPPVAPAVTVACAFSSVGTVDPNGDPMTYAWAFGDGTTSTSASPSKTFATAGTKTVTLTVTDSWNRSNLLTKTITVP
jgi:PKD repeat protein